MSFLAPQIASIVRRSTVLGPHPGSAESAACFYDFIRRLLGVEAPRITPPFAFELHEAQKFEFTDIFAEDLGGWGSICEFRYGRADSIALDFYDSVLAGRMIFEPLLNSLLLPDPRSGIYHVYAPNAPAGPHFVVVSHGGRRRTRFKERLHLAIAAARFVGELRLDDPNSSLPPLEISFKPLLPIGYVVGWVDDYLIFPYAGSPLITFSDGGAPARSAALVLSQIVSALADRDCALRDLTPRNILHACTAGRVQYTISDLENGASRSSKRDGTIRDQWLGIINKNALDYLCLCRDDPAPDNDGLLEPSRIETAYRNCEAVSCFESTLLENGILESTGSGSVTALRDSLIRVFFREPHGCQTFIMLKSLWDRLHPRVYAACLGDMLRRPWDRCLGGEMLSQAMLIGVACEYLNRCSEGRHFLRSNGLPWPSSTICESLVRASVDLLTDAETGASTSVSRRFWLHHVPRLFGLEGM